MNIKFTTDLYTKSANRHQCLHYTLSHSDSIKPSIAYSQVLTHDVGCRISFSESDFQMHMFELKPWFTVRACPPKYFENSFSEFKFVKPIKALLTKLNLKKGVALVVTDPLL